MTKLSVPTSSEQMTLNSLIALAIDVCEDRTIFVNNIDRYTSSELAVIEMALGVGHAFNAITQREHNSLIMEIEYERRAVRFEDR